jgi:hypothetical protein
MTISKVPLTSSETQRLKSWLNLPEARLLRKVLQAQLVECQQELLDNAHKDYFTDDPFLRARAHLDAAQKLRVTLDTFESMQQRPLDDLFTLKVSTD